MARLGTVSCYFNPCAYQSRLRNYAHFREALARSSVDHLTVELVFDEREGSELGAFCDVMTIHGGDVLWQKERLLTIGIREMVARGHEYIAILDADIEFQHEGWSEQVVARLGERDCVQCFEQLIVEHDEGRSYSHSMIAPGVPQSSKHPGAAWAFTAEFANAVGLYEHAVVGGGDLLMSFAWGVLWSTPTQQWPSALDGFQRTRSLSAEGREHFAQWAARGQRPDAPWRFSYPPGVRARLLPHGAVRDRRYAERHRILQSFDPFTDVAVGPCGAFVWNSEKPDMHLAMERYFAGRREDG